MVIANVVGIFAFLYFLWKRLREDYHFEKIFTLASYTLIGLVVSYFISRQFFPEVWFWIEFLGIVVGFGLGVIRLKVRVWESFEGLSIGFLVWLSLVFISDSINNSSLTSFLAFWVTLSLVFLFFFLDSQYRKFSWYASGKVGFAGLFVTGLFFLIRSVVALLSISMISFGSRFESILSGIISFGAFLLLFNLSRKT